MSYEIVKGIKIKDNKVFLKSTSNNVWPKRYDEWEAPSLSKILSNQGKEALHLELMKEYENGNFQAGTKNKYTRALEVLRHMPEYKDYDWRTIKENKRGDIKGFEALLMKALKTKIPKEKYVITKDVNNQRAYFHHHKNSRYCQWYREEKRATAFNFREDAESTKKYFTGSEKWSVEKL